MSHLISQLKTLWGHYSRYLKVIFIISVILFVITSLTGFLRDVNWDRVGDGLSSLSPLTIALLTIAGIVSVIPMLGYDVAITHLLPGKFTVGHIIRSGWVTNTLTNVAGFGGLLGASLRATFYGQQASKKEILNAIAKIAIFLVAGLSVMCWVALVLMFGFHQGGHFNRYAIWLVGGGLYFPAVFFFTRWKSKSLFADLSWRLELLIIISSTLEWLGVALFFVLVGAMMGVHVNLVAVFPLYVVAQLLGVVSMLPGALGSFDLMMMVELVMLGVPHATTVVWLVLFRVFYYLIPLALAGIFFVHHLWLQLDNFLDHLPQAAGRQVAHWVVTTFMYGSGILMLLAASVPDLADNNKLLQQVYPFTFFFLHQLTTVAFAIALLACARGIQAKVAKAYWPSLALLVIGIANTLWYLGTLSLAIFLAVLFFLTLAMRHVLYRKKLQYSLGKFTLDAVIYAGAVILYVIVGLVNNPTYMAKHSIPSFLLFPGEKVWLSGFIGILIGLSIMLLIIHYFTSRPDPFAGEQKLPVDRVNALIEEFGGNETSHLAFLKDKNLYFYQVDGHDRLFFMYRRKYDKLIVMGNPVGDQTVVREASLEFLREANLYGYQLVFYEVNSQLTMLLHEFGFDFLKTGEDGLVKLADFTLAGKKQRSQRALMHKFEREGYQFTIVEPPFSDELMQEMWAVSDDWLGDQVEKGFSLGFFDPDYINTAPVALVDDKDGKLVAFATLMPTGGKEILTIDLMRHSHAAPSGIMDMIFVSMFLYGQEKGYTYFDLGMAPLANVGESRYSFTEERAAHFIYEYGTPLYGFQGLRRYKDKYASEWHSRYTVYRKKNSLLATMIALVSVVNQRADQKVDRHPLMMWWKK